MYIYVYIYKEIIIMAIDDHDLDHCIDGDH